MIIGSDTGQVGASNLRTNFICCMDSSGHFSLREHGEGSGGTVRCIGLRKEDKGGRESPVVPEIFSYHTPFFLSPFLRGFVYLLQILYR